MLLEKMDRLSKILIPSLCSVVFKLKHKRIMLKLQLLKFMKVSCLSFTARSVKNEKSANPTTKITH